MDDKHLRSSSRFQQSRSGGDHPSQTANIIAKRLAKTAGLKEITLHINDNKRSSFHGDRYRPRFCGQYHYRPEPLFGHITARRGGDETSHLRIAQCQPPHLWLTFPDFDVTQSLPRSLEPSSCFDRVAWDQPMRRPILPA
jgi:hypothetical protein